MPGDGRRAGRASARSLRPREIAAVRSGRPLRTKRLIMYLAPADGSPGIAVIAGRRVGGAVVRNRARRILREAWRAVAPGLEQEYRAVLVATPEIRGAKTGEVAGEIAEALGGALG